MNVRGKKKENKRSNKTKRAIIRFIVFIFIVPILVYICDRFDFFSFLSLTDNLTSKYDWLSFAGAYIGCIISAIFLIIITKLDREANTDSIRESQRPNLCTRVYLPNNLRFNDTCVNGYIYMDNEDKNKSPDYYMIRISNSGQTVAVIDMEKSYISLEKYDNIDRKDENSLVRTETELIPKKIMLNDYEDRLHVNPNSGASIIITDPGMHSNKEIYKDTTGLDKPRICEVYIEYMDLFNKRYKDIIEVNGGKTKVICDNEQI